MKPIFSTRITAEEFWNALEVQTYLKESRHMTSASHYTLARDALRSYIGRIPQRERVSLIDDIEAESHPEHSPKGEVLDMLRVSLPTEDDSPALQLPVEVVMG